MKQRLLLLALALTVALAASCERIPPSVSIPGYGKKEAAEEKTDGRPLGTSENPPTFFPNKKAE